MCVVSHISVRFKELGFIPRVRKGIEPPRRYARLGKDGERAELTARCARCPAYKVLYRGIDGQCKCAGDALRV